MSESSQGFESPILRSPDPRADKGSRPISRGTVVGTVDADFDGDKRSDIVLYRPTAGTWFRLNSSDGQFSAAQFGLDGDKPVAQDYDKDGKADLAVWRPSIGDYFIQNSSNGLVQETHWGVNGDIPIAGSGR